MVGLECLRGEELRGYEHMARKFSRVLELLDESLVAEVFANYVFRVVMHGAEAAARDHRVPSAIARGIEGGLFHAGEVLRASAGRRGDDG